MWIRKGILLLTDTSLRGLQLGEQMMPLCQLDRHPLRSEAVAELWPAPSRPELSTAAQQINYRTPRSSRGAARILNVQCNGHDTDANCYSEGELCTRSQRSFHRNKASVLPVGKNLFILCGGIVFCLFCWAFKYNFTGKSDVWGIFRPLSMVWKPNLEDVNTS